jgi:tRNA pseudouridine55 synthase
MRHGFLLIDKPVGPTSHDVVQAVRKQLPERDVGHIGTLDPLASGLLVLAVGSKALKIIEFFQGLSKEYVADVTFGVISSSFDADGVLEEVMRKPGVEIPDEMSVRRVIDDRFIGKISQVPPVYSALHVNGQRAYDLARQGKEVTMQARDVRIEECEILSYEYPHLELRVNCGSGTYIRSLANDLGEAVRCGGYLSALRRTKVGEWSIDNAVDPKKAAWTDVIALKDVLARFSKIELSDREFEDVKHGRKIAHTITTDTFAWHKGLPVAVLCPASEKECRPRKVL